MEDKRSNRSDDDQPTLTGDPASGSSTGIVPPKKLPIPSDAATMIDLGPDSPTMMGGVASVPRPSPDSSGDEGDGLLEAGTVLALRYEILKTLGVGGMGAVYQAKDLALNRIVALKVIRPDLARNAAIVDRFKQELRLSHQVTHKNVIRIYDFGEGGGVKFITMEFIEGQDLRSLIQERTKFPPEEAVEIMRQVCQALEAAHSVGVIHRDLKPQNIMRDPNGRVLVMDFGLARTIEGDGMTQTGALVGTMDYMSPEQALGKELDQRSDIFALGLIFYELLTGKMPFKADSVLASLIKRTQERAAPVSSHDAAIPSTLSGIVSKCLESDASLRYQKTSEVLENLEVWQGKRSAATLGFHANVGPWGETRHMPLIAGVVTVMVLAIGGFLLRHKLFGTDATPLGSGPAISLAVMPFHNASGDPAMNWLGSSLSDMLSTDIGQSARLRMVSSNRLQQVLHDLHISSQSQADVATLRRLAEFTNADTIVYGQYTKIGDAIRIDATVLDLQRDSSSTVRTDVANEKQLLGGIDQLANDVRQRLIANPEILKDLQAHALRPSTSSIQALRDYDDGLQLSRQGKNLDAVKQFEAATSEDANFALAFSKLGETYSNLGYDDRAEKASRRAMELSDSLPAQEKYLIQANHARITNDTQKALAAYENLAKVNPEDADVQFALAGLYEQASNFDQARQYLARVLSHDPKNVDALLASGRVEIKASNPQGGLDFLTRALNLAIQLDNQQQKATILQATGIGYGMLDRPEDALRNYQESLAIKKQIGDKRGIAASLEEIALIQDTTGHPDAALASYKESLAVRREIGDKEGIGNTLIDTGASYHDHGRPDEALKYFTDALQIERDLGNETNQALCLHNIGSIRLDKGEYQDALTYLEQALQLREKLKIPADMAESLHDLAEANTKLGQYDTALSEYLKAIEIRRGINDQHGVALESESMANIFAGQGRYAAALSSMQDAVKIFQQIKERTAFTVEIKGGWGDLLAQVGRGDEGHASIVDALNVAHELKNDSAASLATNWMGDEYFYKGDYNSARQQYDRALELATRAKNREQVLLSKVNRAKTDLSQGRAKAAIGALKKLEQDADTLGLKSLAVECSLYLGASLSAAKDSTGARLELDKALARAEKLGLRVLQAKAHYYLAQVGGAREATPHYREVVRILEGIGKEDHSARVLERADLQAMYRDSMKAFQGAT